NVYYEGEIIKTINDYQDNVITFPDGAGIKEIEIKGLLKGFNFRTSDANDENKVISIEKAGNSLKLSNNGWYFFGTSNLTKIPRDLSLDVVTYITRMFSECDNFNDPNVNFLDVSRVKVMPQVFMDSPKFNQPLGNWDLRNATDIRGMFN